MYKEKTDVNYKITGGKFKVNILIPNIKQSVEREESRYSGCVSTSNTFSVYRANEPLHKAKSIRERWRREKPVRNTRIIFFKWNYIIGMG